jgi:hypothetical protein
VDPEELSNRHDDERDIASELERELRRLCDLELEFRRAHAFERRQLEAIDLVRA